jgi:hypothetical protein
MTAPLVLTLTRRFAVSAERVFDAWLDPALARRFLFAADPAGEDDWPRVAIDIAAEARGCEHILAHSIDSKWAACRTREGWSAILDSLARITGEAA